MQTGQLTQGVCAYIRLGRYTPPGEQAPCATAVGSSNYGYRSQNRDLEAQALIVTTDPALRDRVRAYAYAYSRVQVSQVEYTYTYCASRQSLRFHCSQAPQPRTPLLTQNPNLSPTNYKPEDVAMDTSTDVSGELCMCVCGRLGGC